MSVLSDAEGLRQADPGGMSRHLTGLPEQLEEAFKIGRDAVLACEGRGLTSGVVCGMGGSAIGGEIAAGYLEDRLSIPLEVVRGYSVPAYVGSDTLAVVSSYSGNTEEALSACREAASRGARLVCSTTGGELARLAEAGGYGIVRIPAGLPPRAAIAYSLVPLLVILWRLGLTEDVTGEIADTVETAREAVSRFGPDVPDELNDAKELALWLRGGIPVVYGAAPRTGPVASRWAAQFAENSKVWAHANALPEMNHNEIVGWGTGGRIDGDARVVFLSDSEDHPRVARRIEVTKLMLSKAGVDTREVRSFGRSRLARLFSLVMRGDFTSFYLAVLRGADPTPVAAIDSLKSALADSRDA